MSLVVWVCTPWGTGVGEKLDFTCLLPAPLKTIKMINLGPLLELGTIILTLWSTVNPPLWYLASAVGTEGAGQAGDLEVLPWLVFCLMIIIFLVLCLLNTINFYLPIKLPFHPWSEPRLSVCRLGDNSSLTVKCV